MSYLNPLGIFTESQLDKLKTGNLKNLKKEILLHFQLSDEATIERNGTQYDKNQILEIFDELQDKLDVHFKIYNNKPLLAFLQNKELGFFTNTNSKFTVKHDNIYRNKIDAHIAAQLNLITADLVSNISSTSPEKLQLILEYTSKMDSSIQDKAYNKAYAELKAHIDNLRLKYADPFKGANGLAIYPELNELIDPRLYDCIEHMPRAFTDIGFKYGAWCHNDIVNNAFRRETNYTLFAKDDLKVISKAMDIGCKITKSEAFRENAREIKNYLEGGGSSFQTKRRSTPPPPRASKGKSGTRTKQAPPPRRTYKETSSDNWGGFKMVLIIVLLVFKFAFILTKCNRSNSYSKPNYNRDYYEKQAERMQNRAKRQNRKNNEATLLKFIGDTKDAWNAKLLRTEEVNNVIELDYQVDIFPTHYKDFWSLVPREIKEKYITESKDYVVKFTNPDFPGRSFSYRFRMTANSLDTRNPITLDSKKGENGSKLSFTTKRLLKKKRLKGTITKYQKTNFKEIAKVNFEIADDIEAPPPPLPEPEEVMTAEELKKRKKTSLPTFAEERFDRWDDYAISNVNDQFYKNIILNNFNKVAHKVLKQGNYYKISSMATYSPSVNQYKGFKTEYIRELKCNVRMDYISNEDGIVTVTVYGENLYSRIFISEETQRMIGMNMSVFSANNSVVEVIEVFFE